MKVWLSLPFLQPAGLRELTVAAEECGVSGLALSDHPCVPMDFSSPYPYGRGKPAVLPPETQLPDPLIVAAALTAATSRVRLMTAVLIAPLRHPVMLAKEVATVSALGAGRFDLGVGVGWLREEFEALGRKDFSRRGAVLDEMLDLLPHLWTGHPVAHAGQHFSFDAIAVNPTPAAPVPLFVGGTSDAALRRCAKHADGWVGVNHTAEELAAILGRLREEREKAGTADRPFEVRTGLRGRVTTERVRALRDLGVDAFLLAPWQVGPRRESVHEPAVSTLIEELPAMVELLRTA
ncbi:MAG: TIGR03619 family F420-dependent LLM class oxidoreductase [Pseudonocardia sp.]|uniref:TIGR03619 family F420-dependent LLM class oxidoreductase n=1 Tax=unclassified Pseudonocardia TaxID=2619320 RepID=UPI00086C784C|nr:MULTISPECIES: TIGR03619 family F420-dependent LLM class oxidoreductase [unclassified Pseudonocardia]MBN9109400.1 TIGR03619 family F420-dependent LLM class oxidoreductase [Pseudonocardia sp.]ODU29954.1 MAG: hypothetical protein ABS80_01080 [Pseudonocardia sp. SCN 72-51]